MTDDLNSPQTGPTVTRARLYTWNRFPDVLLMAGVALFFWGLYSEPMNLILVVGGAAVTTVALVLMRQRSTTARPILEEEITRAPDGSVQSRKLRLKLTKVEILFYTLGIVLVFLGAGHPINAPLLGAGLAVIFTVQVLGNWRWSGKLDVGVTDPLSLAYAKLQKVGDEVRSDGYVLRRVAKGLQYREGPRSLTLRSSQIVVEKERVEKPDGTLETSNRLVASIRARVPYKFTLLPYRVTWDPPHDHETIPPAALLRISSNVSEALNAHPVFHVGPSR